jgi:hypothetical protein
VSALTRCICGPYLGSHYRRRFNARVRVLCAFRRGILDGDDPGRCDCAGFVPAATGERAQQQEGRKAA